MPIIRTKICTEEQVEEYIYSSTVKLRPMADKECKSDPGIVIVYSDESNVHAALSLPEATISVYKR